MALLRWIPQEQESFTCEATLMSEKPWQYFSPHIGIDSVRNSDATYVGDGTNCFSWILVLAKTIKGATQVNI